LIAHLEVGVLHRDLYVVRVWQLDGLNFVRFERQEPRRVVLDHPHHDPLGLGQSLAEERGVGLERDVIVAHPLHELIWSGAHGMLAEGLRAVLLERRGAIELEGDDG